VGVNGAGKSTLIKLLAGAETVTQGEFRLGHNVEVDYFAQDQYKALDPSARLIDDLASIAPTAVSDQTRLRTLLGCFLFSDDDVFKRIGVLSGGERNRYAMARMLLQPPNFLLLDEPTNHLDLQAKDVLLEALQKFSGTVVFVSHDRYFIDKLATRIFQIEGGGLYDYPGNYEDFLWQKERRESGDLDSPGELHPGQKTPAVGKREEPEAPAKRLNPILIRKMQKRREELEEEIARCEAEIAAYQLELANFKSAQESIRVAALIDERRTHLKEIMSDWEQIELALQEPSPLQQSENSFD
jgi:ATP-binding cassette subfamily F protein 3